MLLQEAASMYHKSHNKKNEMKIKRAKRSTTAEHWDDPNMPLTSRFVITTVVSTLIFTKTREA